LTLESFDSVTLKESFSLIIPAYSPVLCLLGSALIQFAFFKHAQYTTGSNRVDVSQWIVL
jgi:hypothetical protein